MPSRPKRVLDMRPGDVVLHRRRVSGVTASGGAATVHFEDGGSLGYGEDAALDVEVEVPEDIDEWTKDAIIGWAQSALGLALPTSKTKADLLSAVRSA